MNGEEKITPDSLIGMDANQKKVTKTSGKSEYLHKKKKTRARNVNQR